MISLFPSSFDFAKKSEPSRCIQHRNGSNRRHTVTMKAADFPLAEISEKAKIRFWSKVNKDGPIIRIELGKCWVWTSGKFKSGYGQFQIGIPVRVHRVAYAISVAPIPDGMSVLHKCDNKICVNPEHLFLGTQQDNMADKVSKGRQSSGEKSGSRLHPERLTRGDDHWARKHPERISRGEKHSRAKLTVDQVSEIRSLCSLGLPQRVIAKRFCVCQTTIWMIKQKVNWRIVC